MTYDFHRYANIFPLMEGEAFERLAADILDNGLIEPVVLYDGAILDGRNRYRACQHVGVPARFVDYDGDNPLGFVISKNRHRRHLTSSQLAAIAVQQEELMTELAAEARARQLSTLKQMSAGGTPVTQTFAERANGEANDHVADMFGTNRQYVQDAKRLKEAAPDLLQQVAIGELTIPEAKREHQHRERQERRAELRVVTLEEALTNRTFTVITADPPWQYSNSGFSTSAEAHYPTMPTDAIAAMPVADYAASNAVLFLWATNPLLPDALEVMRAWGFEYKTNMVWVKDRHVAGFYCYGQHELLLIGVKGSAIPEYVPSSLIQAPVSRHSAKPESVYELIERMYPHGPYLELFARAEREGWATFGNEVPCGE